MAEDVHHRSSGGVRASRRTVLDREVRRRAGCHCLTEQRLRLTEQRLRLTEQRLRLTEQRLRLTEQRLRLTEQRLRLTESRRSLPAGWRRCPPAIERGGFRPGHRVGRERSPAKLRPPALAPLPRKPRLPERCL